MATALLSGAAWPTSPEETQEVSRDGDLLQLAIPAVGFGLTFLLQAVTQPAPSGFVGSEGVLDPLRLTGSPRHDFVAAGLRTELMTLSLKASVDEKRPNGGPHSFPSGHTSIAFMGAEFIRKEYGGWWGAPAYAAAAFVGWTRVASHNHHGHDVVAGAGIGILGNHDVAVVPFPSGTLSLRPALLVDDSAGGAAPREGLGLELRYDFAVR